MKTKWFLFFALMGMTLSFAACGDWKEGDWDPMEWSGYSKNKDVVVNVPAEESSTVLHCKNYDGFWLYGVLERCDTTTKTYYENDSTFDFRHAATDWADIQCSGAQLQVKVKRNDSGMDRALKVGVTAGDIGDVITFIQAAK